MMGVNRGEGETGSDWRDDVEADKLRDEAFRRLLDVPPKRVSSPPLVLGPSGELKTFVEAVSRLSELAPHLDPVGETAECLVQVIQCGLRLRCVEGEAKSTVRASDRHLTLAPDLSEADWRFLSALLARNVNALDKSHDVSSSGVSAGA